MVKGDIVIAKRYNVLSKIGTGGMADVYKGKDMMLNRYVAIKVLKKEYREDENFVRKFRSEAQAAAGLMHPNIVNVYDVGEDRGLYYMVMELVEGITLKEYIRRKGKLTHKELISIAIQMCTGIGAAHDAHIIHRDIKPQNIIISKEGKVKVTDFGIAKATTSNTISTNAMGSVHYSSPEQVRGGYSDEKSDIYSVGITLYEMATGELPFDGDSTVSVAIKHLKEEMVPPSELVPSVPYSLEQIILKCTQKSTARRYANTDELIRDLKRSLIDPEGNFVMIPPLNSASTVMLTESDLDRYQDGYEDDGYDEDEDYDDYEDEDDYDNRRRRRDYDDDDDDDEEDDDGTDPRMKKVTKVLTVVVAILVIFIVVFAIGKAAGIFKSFGNKTEVEETSDEVEVPSVLGKTEEEAKEILNGMALGIKVVGREESEQYEEGQICKQSPDAEETVKKNTTIEVTISTGLKATEVEIPDVAGYDEDTARKTLTDAGIKVGETQYAFSSRVDEGEVIETSPAAHTKIKTDQEVIMTVSKGSEKITVPNVVGKSDSSAQSTLKNLGLDVSARYDYSDTVEKGKVVDQSVSAGSKVESGTEILITVSNGKKPEEDISIPSLSGQSYSGAKALLESKGFSIADGGTESSNVPVGQVTRWEPSGKAKKGTSVTVWISSGPAPTPTPDPAPADSNTTVEVENGFGN